MKNGLFEGGSRETQKKKKTMFYAICATLAVLVAMLIFLIIFTVASQFADKPDDTDQNEPIVSIGETTTTTFKDNQLYSGNLLLLNSENKFEGTPDVESIQDNDGRPKRDDGENAYTVLNKNKSLCVTTDTVDAFNNMVKAFYASTKNDNLIVQDAYNTSLHASQNAIFSAGTSIQLGYFTVDDNGKVTGKEDLSKTGDFTWLYNNASKYGFINVIVDGEASNIFRYVGVEHAAAIKSNGGTLEKYLDNLKANTSAEKPLLVKGGTTSYAVYYLSANGELKVPVSGNYTVSGNNTDGYIVTVKVQTPSADSEF